MKILSKLGAIACALAMSLAFVPVQAFAANPNEIIVHYADSSTYTTASLADAIAKANVSEGTVNPAVRLEIGAGTFTPDPDPLNYPLQITKSNLVVEGDDPATTLISTGAVSVFGQAGLMVSGDQVTIRNLAITSGGGGNVSALKIVKPGNSNDVPLVPVLACVVSNVAITSQGHGLNIHGAAGVTVDQVTIVEAVKLGIAIADATGVTIDNSTIGPSTSWGKDIGIMYLPYATYQTPSQVVLGPNNAYANNVLCSERPSDAPGGPDTLGASGWILKPSANPGDAWIMEPQGIDPIPFKDEANDMSFSSFALACAFAPQGATITMQSDVTGGLAIPASASGKDLTVDGGGHTLQGGLVVDPAAALSGLTIQNFAFADGGFSSAAPICALGVAGNTFTNTPGTAIEVSNLTGSAAIFDNTVENWGTGGSGHAIQAAFAPGINPSIAITENSFVSSSFDPATSGSIVQVSGAGLSGAIDLSHNYWNALDPSTATAAGGVPVAELLNAGSATKTVFPYYADQARTILVNYVPQPQPKPLSQPGSLAATGDSVNPIGIATLVAAAALFLFAARAARGRGGCRMPKEGERHG